ncbi:alx-1 [Pristionchus pacificus]|uniref:Alx-1 n=1 Tax=Pristionchus pacificus TaxID=54126 RepID=A0A2A6BB52_PRIPA|nr:alx-1 [Pristionchus pacificus]|eukprot:PDM63096.1 alx-1 [Pristionchus pacificus]
MSGFIFIPLKKTHEVDLIKPFTTYINTVYETKEDDKAEAMQELNKLRAKACCQPLDKHQSGLDLLTRYYDQLVAIENKIIISATQNPVVFKWQDAFDKGGLFFSKASLSLSDGAFERAAVLFNVGAFMTQVAALQPLLTDEELKTTAGLFQKAAGVFFKLRDSVHSLVPHDATPDLCPDTLSACGAIALAQAQEAIYIKARKDKMKPNALTRIAAQAADFYTEAQKAISKDTVKGLFEKENYYMIVGKAFAYQALAQYHGAEEHGESQQIGMQLSRLNEAIKLADQTRKYLPPTVLAEQLAAIPKAHAAAKKDNDFIYHERVPDVSTLPVLAKAAVAKALPVTHPISPRFKDMFSSVVPVQVHNAMQSYEARKGDLVNMQTMRMREATQLMNGILASLNLPAALDDVTSTETLPESIKLKSAKVKQAGGITELHRLFNELPGLYKRNEEIIDEAARLLKEEQSSDDNLRTQFGSRWTRMSSQQLTGPLLQELGKYRGILATASNADKMVKTKFEQNREGIELLSRAESDLRGAIPSQQPHATGGGGESVRRLRELCGTVAEVIAERDRLEKELKERNCDIAGDFLQALAESQLLNEEQISKEKIDQIYGPAVARVNESLSKQESLLADIQRTNTMFCAEKSNTGGGAERERILKMLATAHDAYLELKGNLEEGTKFYNDLTPILVRLQQKISDFSFARQTEKEDLMRQVQQNIVAGDAGAGNTAAAAAAASAPPRPPPPRTTSAAGAPPSMQQQQQQAGEAPIAPPRTTAPQYSAPPPQQQQQNPFNPAYQQPPQQQQQQQVLHPTPQMGQQMPPPYYQQPMPYGQPQPFQQPNYYQPQYNPSMAAPYPTFPGAYSNYQQPQYAPYPPQPAYGQAPPPPHGQAPPPSAPPPSNNLNPFQ